MTTIVITGASGNVGRPLVAALATAGVSVRAVTRDAARVRWPDGVQAVGPESLPAALDGADGVFLNPRATGPHVTDLLHLAHRTGVRRAVALSAINVDDPSERQPSRYRGDRNREVEAAVTAWPGQWVVLRPSVFAGNVLGLWAPQLRVGDRVHGPYAEATSAPIDERDIAAVAAVALLDDDLVGRRVPLTGPQVMTPREMVADLADVLGRDLDHVELDPAVVRARMIDQGFPSAFAEAYLAMQAAATEQPAAVSPEVARILGRPPTTFRQWARDHAERFRSGPVPTVSDGAAADLVRES